MSKFTLSIAIAVASGILSLAPSARAPLLELDGCHDDLDRLRRTASDASDGAEDAHSKLEEFEDCRRDEESSYGCASQRSDYQSALSDLESEMDDLDSRLWSVQSSCEYEFTVNRMSAVQASQRKVEAAKRRLCTSIKKLIILGITPSNALQMCKVNADEQTCKACLGLK